MALVTKDAEMNRAIRILDQYTNIEDLIGKLNYKTAREPENAGVIITTCHRAKGLEFDKVIIADDFSDIPTEIPCDHEHKPLMTQQEFEARIADELNLMYVAITRAKKIVTLTPTFNNIIDEGFRLSSF